MRRHKEGGRGKTKVFFIFFPKIQKETFFLNNPILEKNMYRGICIGRGGWGKKLFLSRKYMPLDRGGDSSNVGKIRFIYM